VGPDALITVQEHRGPREPQHGIPSEEWPQVVRRVLEHHEPLRQVAADYEVSRETIRRILRIYQTRDSVQVSTGGGGRNKP
jgi:Bacterial regulatory proteins, gntR family